MLHGDRLAGGLEGLLIGDALGVPYEFHPPRSLPPMAQIDMDPPAGFQRAHAGTPPGTWSDDGAQALCLLASLLAHGKLRLVDFAQRLVNWADWGYMAVDGRVFDIGVQTRQAIDALRSGVSPKEAGPAGEYANGNGALMRVLPLALWHTGSDGQLIAMAARQSLPTHGHARSAVACAMLCLWARAELYVKTQTWSYAASLLRGMGPSAGLPTDEIEHVLSPAHRERAGGSGYVLDTLWSARVAIEDTGNYADAVRWAVALGHDTDTTAAVTGGIAGIRYGLEGIPIDWRQRLRGRELLDPLKQQLLHHAAIEGAPDPLA
ncbi:ADP-ribosylglycohydrolase family protein [Dyella sp.]|uniref:ADP-ribosylglycohydrolase family protein n=1 Tax=Dyella sp. TaxID=1869338 RepID=UPI002ED4EE93